MRRTSLLLAVLLLVALVSSASAVQDGGTGERPPLRAALAACQAGATAEERFAIFTGSMPARKATVRMAMRFDLFERTAGGSWERIVAPGFGRWERSQPLRAGFVWSKRLERLRDGAEYRSAVRFRWYGARGKLQGETRRTTPSCRQPDRRADLEVDALDIAPAADGRARYAVTVLNAGQSPAGPFDVGVASARTDGTRPVAGLEPGERTTVEIVADACAGVDLVTATADVRDTVDEADERGNTLSRPCSAR